MGDLRSLDRTLDCVEETACGNDPRNALSRIARPRTNLPIVSARSVCPGHLRLRRMPRRRPAGARRAADAGAGALARGARNLVLSGRHLRVRRAVSARSRHKRARNRVNPIRQAISRHRSVGYNHARLRHFAGVRPQPDTATRADSPRERSTRRGDRVERNGSETEGQRRSKVRLPAPGCTRVSDYRDFLSTSAIATASSMTTMASKRF
jgi:hypothetical protein